MSFDASNLIGKAGQSRSDLIIELLHELYRAGDTVVGVDLYLHENFLFVCRLKRMGCIRGR